MYFPGMETLVGVGMGVLGNKATEIVNKVARRVLPAHNGDLQIAVAAAMSRAAEHLYKGEGQAEDAGAQAKRRVWKTLQSEAKEWFVTNPNDATHAIVTALKFVNRQKLATALNALLNRDDYVIPVGSSRVPLADGLDDAARKDVVFRLRLELLEMFGGVIKEDPHDKGFKAFQRDLAQATYREVYKLRVFVARRSRVQQRQYKDILQRLETIAKPNSEPPDAGAVFLNLANTLRVEAEATREVVRAEAEQTRKAIVDSNTQTQPKLDRMLQIAENLKPSAPDAPPVNSNLPARNECFTARENELTAIARAFETRRCVALVGQGGVGKSELALEYAHRSRDLETQPTYRIIAETGAEFASNLADIARLRRFPLPPDAKQPEQLAAVYAWLQTTDDWLLILDNADDPTIIADLLRLSLRGHILLTMQPTPTNALVHPLPVETLSPADSARLLLTRAGRLPSDSPPAEAQQHPEYPDALALGAELDGLPLAIDHAAAYIASPPGITVRGYLDRYRKPGSRVLRKDFPDALRPHASVYQTVEIALERTANNPAALDVLYACAFLAPDAIPAFLLQRNAPLLGDALKPAAEDEEAWDEAIQGACCYGLLTPDGYAPDGQVFSFAMHRVTQRVLRDMLDGEKRHDRAARVVQAVNAVFPDPELNTWPVCSVLTPHAQSCAGHIATEKIQTLEAARLLNQTGCYLDDIALYSEAEPLYIQALDIYRQAYGEQHPHVATSLNNLAELYRSQGRYAEAEPLYIQALDIRRKALPEDHPDIAESLNNLALLYKSQGRSADAEPLLVQALHIHLQVYGGQHPHVATSLNNLAGLYKSQGRSADAEPLYIQALDIDRVALGENHPDYAIDLNNLAGLYESQGRYAEAEPLYIQALDIFVVSLNSRHPNTITVLDNFLIMLIQQERMEDAGAFLDAKPELEETYALLLAQQSA